MKVISPRKVKVRSDNLKLLLDIQRQREQPSTPELARKQANLLALLARRQAAS